jgi:hypothetical protein
MRYAGWLGQEDYRSALTRELEKPRETMSMSGSVIEKVRRGARY